MSLSLLRTFILYWMILAQAAPVLAIRVQGHARDAFTRLPMRGVVVVLEVQGVRTEQCTTRIDGFYRFEVPVGQRYGIRFERHGLVTRHVVFDTRAVPREWVDALEAELDMRLFPPLDGMDSALVNAPAGTASWDPVGETIIWDTVTSGPLVEQWNALLDQHAARHPEVRPTALQRWAVKGFELARGYGGVLAFLLLGLMYIVSRALLERIGYTTRLVLLVLVLIGACWLLIDLGQDAGPLRYLAFVALVTGLGAAFHLVMELWVGGLIQAVDDDVILDTVNDGPEDEVDPTATDDELEGDLDEEAHAQEPERRAPRWKPWMSWLVFFGAQAALIGEWRWGLENTLDVWPLVGAAAGVGLMIAGLIAWSRAPNELRRYPRLLVLSGGIWWVALPLFLIAASSCINRSFPQAEERCRTWPVVDVIWTRRNVNVYVSRDGERERIEMPRTLKEQLTTMDSLRCCSRTGLFGFDHVGRVETVITPDDRR
jgi:hypothetical protein